MKNPATVELPRAGFTLVELLVVIAIIMILLLLMMTPLQGVRDKAYTLQCASNLRSIGIAANLYAGENNDAFPSANNWASANADFYQWTTPDSLARGTLFPYLGNTKRAFLCPIFVRTYKINPDLTHLTAHMNYVMNHFYGDNGWHGYVMRKRSDATHPTELGLFAEENPYFTKYNNYILNDLRIAVGYFDDPGHVVDAVASYHNPTRGDLAEGYGNVCFADGHVELIHISDSKEVFTPEVIKAKAPQIPRRR